MKIQIFNKITTENALLEIEAESKKYEGLYVEMANKDERKYVKDKAEFISSILKNLDRARIDESKRYKILVEQEAKSIRGRLEEANKPFTLLIDEYKEVRAKELRMEKEKQDAIDLAFQIEVDHDDGLDLNKLYDLEKIEREREEEKRKVDLYAEFKERVEKSNEEKERKAKSNRERVSNVRREIKEKIMRECGMTEQDAKIVVLCILKIDSIKIIY